VGDADQLRVALQRLIVQLFPAVTIESFGQTVRNFVIVYQHVLYPVLLRLLASGKSDVQACECLADADLPSIELILPAFNEAAVVAAKIRNVAALNYPADKLKITLIGDGCTDNTIAIAQAVANEPCCIGLSLEIDEHINNRGKVEVINQAVKDSKSDIVALSDISALINVDALRMAARRFLQAKVGVVNSTYQFANYSSQGEKIMLPYCVYRIEGGYKLAKV
jgi:cellulose synthase/poly-beta-1,6-N-acetylglucosamine synthase-like glycosyltransferase